MARARFAALSLLALWPLGAGCAGEVSARVEVTPPTPAPTAAPVASSAAPPSPSPVPEEPVPATVVDGDEVRYVGVIEFAADKMATTSTPVIEGIAQLLKEHPEIELVDIGVHLATAAPDAEKATKKRADSLLRALEEAGVEKKRLRATGYGARCPIRGPAIGPASAADEDGVAIKVVRRSGKDTAAPLCGAGV